MLFFVTFGLSATEQFAILQPGESLDYCGEIIGSNGTIDTITEFRYYLNDKLVSTENVSSRNPVFIVAYEKYRPDGQWEQYRKTTQCKCASKHPCKIQYITNVYSSINMKFIGKYYKDMKTDQNLNGYFNRIATFSSKKEGNLKFDVYLKIENKGSPNKPMTMEDENHKLYVLGDSPKKFSFDVRKGVDALCKLFNTTWRDGWEREYQVKVFEAKGETEGRFEYVARTLDCEMYTRFEGNGISKSSMNISWKEIAQVSADTYYWNEGEKMLIPEFEAKIPFKGVFTLDDLNKEEESEQEGKTALSGGAIAGIVIGVIVAVACIVVVCLWLFVFRKQKEEANNEEGP